MNALASDNVKANEFIQAMQCYLSNTRYKRFEVMVSYLIVTLQLITGLHVLFTYESTPIFYLVLSFALAYVAADFINGLVHLFMDNNTHYTSIVGPYVAAFHLHHMKYTYRERHPLNVYFDESGTKFWLLIYLLCLAGAQWKINLGTPLNVGLVAFGVFSSVAELSHYWCHNATKKNHIILWLQKKRVLLSKSHHKAHHCSDNVQYAFLNGMTDPVIDSIARRFYRGYKNYADQHAKAYMQFEMAAQPVSSSKRN